MDNQRLLLAAALSAVLLIVWTLLFPPLKKPVQRTSPPAHSAPSASESAASGPGVEMAQTAPTAEAGEGPAQTAPGPVERWFTPLEDTSETQITLESPEARVNVSNRGARINSWTLPGYNDYGEKDSAIELVPRLGKGHTFKDLFRNRELESAALVLKAILQGSLAPQESRGSFIRKDFPGQNDREWLKNSCYRLEKSELQVTHRPLPQIA